MAHSGHLKVGALLHFRVFRHCFTGTVRSPWGNHTAIDARVARERRSEGYSFVGYFSMKTLRQVLSGLNESIRSAIFAVFGPRSFSKTVPAWLTKNVITPELRYSAG